MSQDSKSIRDDYERMHSRENVIKCPESMRLLGYLQEKHGLPKYGWRKDGLRYHYTDATGLLGIIQNSRLWATDLRFLNDPSEGDFLPERLLDIMGSKCVGSSDTEQKIIEGVKKALRDPRSDYATFCVSLSTNGDLLSQWRGYGGFGKGYAVGLNLGLGNRLPHPQIASYYDVVYGDEGLQELATDLLDLFVSSADKWEDQMYDEWAFTLRVIAKSFKDISYKEEKESRLICKYSENTEKLFGNELPIHFRARGSDIVPYIPMSLSLLENEEEPHLPIERIVVGPGVDFERNQASIKALLKVHSYDNVKVEQSIIPFRP